MVSVDDLKPCPFCGESTAFVRQWNKGKICFTAVRCAECGIRGPKHEGTEFWDSPAIRFWNTRSDTTLKSRILELEEALGILADVGEQRRVEAFDPTSRVTVLETRTKDIIEFHDALDAARNTLSNTANSGGIAK